MNYLDFRTSTLKSLLSKNTVLVSLGNNSVTGCLASHSEKEKGGKVINDCKMFDHLTIDEMKPV